MRVLATSALIVLLSACSAAAQDVGVPECDEYLKYYEQCLATYPVADVKKRMSDPVHETRKSYIDLKAQGLPNGQLGEMCLSNWPSMKQTFEAMKCKPRGEVGLNPR
jgi:hypothetical protein